MESNESEEVELLKRFLAGDEDAERVLLELGYEDLKGHLRYKTWSAEEAASLAMSAIAEFLKDKRKGRHQYLDSLKRLFGLLHTIGERRLIRRLQLRGGTPTQSLDYVETVADKHPTSDEQVEASDEQVKARALMAAVMARLPDDDLRNTLKMYLDGKSKVDIARAFDVQERTIYYRLDRIDEVLEEFREEAKQREQPAD